MHGRKNRLGFDRHLQPAHVILSLFSRGSHVTNPWTNLGGSVDLDPTGVRKFSDLDFNTE